MVSGLRCVRMAMWMINKHKKIEVHVSDNGRRNVDLIQVIERQKQSGLWDKIKQIKIPVSFDW